MDIETIKTFIILSKTKHFTQTANQLFVAQSTITNRISSLEKELNTQLFIRNNKSVALTLEGELYLQYAERMLELTESSLSAISQLKKYAGSLHIGTVNSLYEGYLSNTIGDFIKAHKNYAIKISISQSSHLIEQLQDNILDMIIGYLPLKKAGFSCQLFKKEHLVLVTSASNTQFLSGIHKEDLVNINFLMCNFALQDVGQFIRGLFPKYYQFSLEIDDCSTVIPFLLGQSNYSFLPKQIVEPYLKTGALREIPLLDFDTPTINSYVIANLNKKELLEELWNSLKIN